MCNSWIRVKKSWIRYVSTELNEDGRTHGYFDCKPAYYWMSYHVTEYNYEINIIVCGQLIQNLLNSLKNLIVIHSR